MDQPLPWVFKPQLIAILIGTEAEAMILAVDLLNLVM